MRISLLPIAFVGLFSFAYAQVGINTDAPKATLDISASPLDNEKTDGVLIPKLTGDNLRAKNELYKEDQHGALLYVTEADTQPADKTENVTSPGFYFYDHGLEKWTKLGEGSGTANPSKVWMTQKETETDIPIPATSTAENISHLGQLAIGFDGITQYEFSDVEDTQYELSYPSNYDLDVEGNYQIRKEMQTDAGKEWFTDALTSLDEYEGMLLKQNTNNKGEPDRLFKGTKMYNSLLNNSSSNKSTTDKNYIKLKSWGHYPTPIIPYISLILPDIALEARRNISINYETGNGNLTRYFDFSDGVNNSTTFGYIEGGINLQTLKIPGIGEPSGDLALSMSRIFINKPQDNGNYIELTSRSIIDENTFDTESSQVLIKHNGIQHEHTSNIHGNNYTRDTYTFPRTVGTNGQVLALDNVSFFADYNHTSGNLVWKDPLHGGNIWRIQNTETPAASNTDNIYLNGKLAVGFTQDDEVSQKSFEIKGDIKVQNENNGYYNLFETNTPSFLSGLPSIQLLTTENTDIFQSEKISGILADPIIFSAFNTNPSANSSTAITLQEGNFSLSTSEQPQGAGYWMSHASGGVDGMFLAYQKNSFPQGTGIEKRREIAVNDYSGIRFLFIEKEKNISQEGYYFPLNSGEKGQVLTVGDATPGNSMKINQLVWKYPGTIPMHNIPTYTDDAAADADANLESGALYKLNGSRAVYQKP